MFASRWGTSKRSKCINITWNPSCSLHDRSVKNQQSSAVKISRLMYVTIPRLKRRYRRRTKSHRIARSAPVYTAIILKSKWVTLPVIPPVNAFSFNRPDSSPEIEPVFMVSRGV